MPTALITGGGSFVAQRITDVLISVGFDVTVTTRTSGQATRLKGSRTNARVVSVDLTDEEAIGNSLDPHVVVIHAAATSLHGQLDARLRHHMYSDNVIGTRNLAVLASKWEEVHFVYLSTMSVYGSAVYGVVSECTAPHPGDLYGGTKLIGERLCARLLHTQPFLALRLPAVLGPGSRRHWLARVRALLEADAPVSIHSPSSRFNNAIHVDDLAALVARWIETPSSPSLVSPVASSAPIPLLSAVQTMRHALGSSSEIATQNSSHASHWIDDARARKLLEFRTMTITEALLNYCQTPIDETGG